ncbi:hypothetical protein DFQ27_000567, partial [Actinomortierella ambigua]
MASYRLLPDGSCGGWALNAQRSSRLPEKYKYKYSVYDLSGSTAKAAFPGQANELSADKTYLFTVRLKACKPSHAFKQVPVLKYNNTVITKTVYDLSLEVGFDPTYVTLFKNLLVVQNQYSISGGDKTVFERHFGLR